MRLLRGGTRRTCESKQYEGENGYTNQHFGERNAALILQPCR